MGLTDAERQAYTDFFNNADKDGSGFLTIQELKNVIQNDLCLSYPDDQIIEMFLGVDGNNDKKVTLDEYLTEMEKVNPKDLKEADFKRAFKLFDRDNNGTLAACEVKQLFEHVGEQISDDEVQKLVMQLDKDGSGQINFNEFLAMCT